MNVTRKDLILLISFFAVSNVAAEQKSLRQGSMGLINPLLECADDARFQLLHPFKYKIENYVNSKIGKKISQVSVYFRDLNNGPWFGINENVKFTPASLLKVPLMMCYFEQAESNPEILRRKIQYEVNEGFDDGQDFKPEQRLIVGETYTVEELIRQMIIYSDNEAANLLDKHVDSSVKSKTYTDLGIEVPGVRGADDFMEVRDYASFLRILYNASYLGRRMSNEALQILTETDFNEGLEKGVPPNIKVAHKFGEKRYIDGATKNLIDMQLHDCGIIYHPVKPFLLCIMTRGRDFKELSLVISEISRLIYHEIELQIKTK